MSNESVHAPATPNDPSTASRSDPEAGTAGSPLRVLVVDDNTEVAECISLLLEVLGHKAFVVHCGADACDAARRDRPDVMLIDIGMPVINGYDLARQLRADPELRQIRLIALSGYGQEEDRRRAREAGFDAHLTKPAGSEALQTVLR